MKKISIIMILAVMLSCLTACTTDDVRGLLDIVDKYEETGEITLDENNEFVKEIEEYVKDKIPNVDEMEELIEDLNDDVEEALEKSGY